MSTKVKIYGAGSCGNHLAQASRRKGWDVSIVDASTESLRRMREDMYPARYGVWDLAIKQFVSGEEPMGGVDVVFIATPPDVRLDIAFGGLKNDHPRILALEKPLCALKDFARI